MSINSVIYKNLYCKENGLIIPVESDLWWDYLLINKSFHYQYESLHCHFSKDKKGYWTAVKTIKGKKRAKRMGIYRDLTIENMLAVVYQLNLSQDDYEKLRENKKQHSSQNSKTWLKEEVKCQRQTIYDLKKQVKELENKLNEDRQNQEITKLKNQIKELKTQLKDQLVEYIEINGKIIPCLRDSKNRLLFVTF